MKKEIENRTGLELTEKQQKRRERILNVAENHIYKNGFYKLSLDDLVQTLRISKSTIYENFGSKDGLVEAVVERFEEKMESELEDLVFNDERPVKDRLLRVAEFQGKIVIELTSRFLNDLRIHTPHLWDLHLQRKAIRRERYYRKLIEQGFQAGIFDKKLDLEFVLRLYMEMSGLVCTSDILDHVSMSRAEAYESIIAIFLKGVKPIDI